MLCKQYLSSIRGYTFVKTRPSTHGCAIFEFEALPESSWGSRSERVFVLVSCEDSDGVVEKLLKRHIDPVTDLMRTLGDEDPESKPVRFIFVARSYSSTIKHALQTYRVDDTVLEMFTCLEFMMIFTTMRFTPRVELISEWDPSQHLGVIRASLPILFESDALARRYALCQGQVVRASFPMGNGIAYVQYKQIKCALY